MALRSTSKQSDVEILSGTTKNVIFICCLLIVTLLVYMGERLSKIEEFLTAIGGQLSVLAFFTFIIQGIYSKNIYQLQTIWPFQLYVTLITFITIMWNPTYIEVLVSLIILCINIYLFIFMYKMLKPYNAHFKTYYFRKLGGDPEIQDAFQLYMRVSVLTRIYLVLFTIQVIQELITISKYKFIGISKILLVLIFYGIDINYKNEENWTANTICIGILLSEFTASMGAIIIMPQIYTDDNPEGALITAITKCYQLFLVYLKYKSYGKWGSGLKKLLKTK